MNRAPLRRVLGSTALAAVLAVGCADERTIVTDPIGPLSFDFLVPSSAGRLPSGTTAGQFLYFLSSASSDLGGGADFSLRLAPRTRTPVGWSNLVETPTDVAISVAAATTETSFAFTDPGIPGRDGHNADYSIVFATSAFEDTLSLFVRFALARVDAAGVVQTSGVAGVETRINGTGFRTFTFRPTGLACPAPPANPGPGPHCVTGNDLGTWNPGDRLRIEYRIRNAHATLPRTLTIATGAQTLTRPTRSVTLTLSNLPALGGGARYQFWALGRNAANLDVAVPLYGTLVEFFSRVDTLPNGDTIPGPTGDPQLTTDSLPPLGSNLNMYTGSPDSAVSWLRITADSTGDGGAPATYHAIFVTRENADVTTPGPVRFLWRRIGLALPDVTATMLFGNFGGSDLVNIQSPGDYVYAPIGAGVGGARGPEIAVEFTEIPRPPIGFFYRGVILDANGQNLVVDTLRSAYNEDASLSRASLFDADIDPLLPGIAGTSIRRSQIRNCAAGSNANNCQNTLALPVEGTFLGMAKFQLKLEPKGNAGSLSNVLVSHAGDLPDEVKQ